MRAVSPSILEFVLIMNSSQPQLAFHTQSFNLALIDTSYIYSMYVLHPAFNVLSMTYILPAVLGYKWSCLIDPVVSCLYSNDILANFSFDVSIEVKSMVVRVISISGLLVNFLDATL